MKKVAICCFAFAVVLSGCDLLGTDSKVISRVMLLEDAIGSHHAPAGVFHSKTVTLNVPSTYGSIVVSTDKNGKTPFGVDDYLRLSITSDAGLVQTVILQRNGGNGAPIGEQSVLSNVTTLAAGTYTVLAEWCNEFAPPGGNASASPAWIVVLKD